MFKRLPDNCAALYADLLQKVDDSALVTLSGGTFTAKTIHGKRYWYYQTRPLSGQVQKYLGKESTALLAKIAQAKSARTEAQSILTERRRLVAMLGVSGATPEKGRPAKILEKMADAGLFAAGGVLVGSFAFASYGNMLGVMLDAALSRTEDMDFSVERELEIGLQRDMKHDLVAAAPDLITPAQINPWVAPFEMKSPDGFKIEFLTTKIGAHDKAPVLIKRFGIHALPLDFMDYLIEDAQRAVVLNGAGIPVRVPNPARYAVHKLAISQLRPIGMQTKLAKDIRQASALIAVLAEDNPGALLLAVEAASARKDGMLALIKRGRNQLEPPIREAFDNAG